MIKSKKINIYGILAVFITTIFVICTRGVVANADEIGTRVTVELIATDNGIPQSNAVYRAYNLDKVYQKILNGTITDEDTSSSSWKNLQNQAQADPTKIKADVIRFANGLAIGPGLKHSPQDTSATITYILRMGGLPLLIELNGETTSILFHQSERGKISNTFTDNRGRAVAELPKGITAITTNGGSFRKLLTISKENQKISLDAANVDSRLKFSLEKGRGVEKASFGKFIVESGQASPLTFKLTINKDFNRSGGVFVLSQTSNLIVTSVSAPSNVGGVEITPIAEVGAAAQSNPKRQIKIPALSQNITLTIKAYVTPTSIQDAPIGGSTLSLTGADDNGTSISAQSPAVVLAGANFAMMDNEKNTLAVGAEYVLGKRVNTKYQMYSAEKGWVTVSSLENLDLSQLTVLKGGRQYSIGNTASLPIPYATNRFNFNASTNNKINQSLIQIIGLAQGKDYFLYQVNLPAGNTGGSDVTNFSVFAKFMIGRDGKLLAENSLGKAIKQNFSINTTIPDFHSGVNEYNIVSVGNGQSDKIDVMKKIVLPIALICLLILVIGFVLVKII